MFVFEYNHIIVGDGFGNSGHKQLAETLTDCNYMTDIRMLFVESVVKMNGQVLGCRDSFQRILFLVLERNLYSVHVSWQVGC